MNDEKKGIDVARAAADKIRAENAKEVKIEEKKKIAMSQLEVVRNNSSLSERFAAVAKEEAKEMMGIQPLLKLHIAGRSNNELIDGSEPKDLSFFYVPTQEEFINPDVHVLVMSDGFYAEGVSEEGGERKITYNILLGGTIIAEGSTSRAFIMYINGQKKRESFWEFRNDIAKYARLLRVPKSILSVKLTSGKVPNPNPKWAKVNPKVSTINFSINKHEDGSPVLVTDEGEFVALEDTKELLKEMINSIIARKSVEKPVKDEEAQIVTPVHEAHEGDIVEDQAFDPEVKEGVAVDPDQNIDPDQIPF